MTSGNFLIRWNSKNRFGPMPTLHFRFYEELNDYLPAAKRKVRFAQTFKKDPATVQEALRSLGVPLHAIDLVLVNGEPAEFSRRVEDGDEVSVYPEFESFDIGPLTPLADRPLRRTRFVLDVHLGKLAKKLRLLGLDCLYRNDYTDRDLLSIVEKEKRILLTRDRRLLESKKVTHGIRVLEEDPDRQTVEIVHRLDLLNALAPFTRCLECNRILQKIEKSGVTLRSKTRTHSESVYRCPECKRIYWQGFDRMRRFVTQIKKKTQALSSS